MRIWGLAMIEIHKLSSGIMKPIGSYHSEETI